MGWQGQFRSGQPEELNFYSRQWGAMEGFGVREQQVLTSTPQDGHKQTSD